MDPLSIVNTKLADAGHINVYSSCWLDSRSRRSPPTHSGTWVDYLEGCATQTRPVGDHFSPHRVVRAPLGRLVLKVKSFTKPVNLGPESNR